MFCGPLHDENFSGGFLLEWFLVFFHIVVNKFQKFFDIFGSKVPALIIEVEDAELVSSSSSDGSKTGSAILFFGNSSNRIHLQNLYFEI